MSDKVIIFEQYEPEVQVKTSSDNALLVFCDDAVITVLEPGPMGQKGDRGETGFSGAGEPFYVITSGSMYATSASLAINAFVSSSILPWSSSFNLGSSDYLWKNIYVSESFYIIKSGIQKVKIGNDEFQINDIPIKFISSSVSSSFINGIFIISEFNNMLPNPISGGLIKSGSNFYFGI